VSTYIRHRHPQRLTSAPTGANYRSHATVLIVALCAGCDASPRSGAPGDDPVGARPALETTLHAAPFQSSAITLVGTVAQRTQAWTFQRFTADLRFKASVPTSLEVSIDTGSTATSDPALKLRLLGADLLDVAAHPRATFRATDLRELSRAGDVATYTATGVLALAGRTQSATIPLEISHSGPTTLVRVTTHIDGRAWHTAFHHAPDGVFDDSLQLQARLVFPIVDSQ
jgi:polyisoprenoid-binding protein YceI